MRKGKTMKPTWRDDAACLPEESDLFFPAGETGQHAIQAEEAKAVCARCPVVYDCLLSAFLHHDTGVWGGLTEAERKNIRSKTTSKDWNTKEKLRHLLEVEMPACEECGLHRKEKADGMCATCYHAAVKVAA